MRPPGAAAQRHCYVRYGPVSRLVNNKGNKTTWNHILNSQSVQSVMDELTKTNIHILTESHKFSLTDLMVPAQLVDTSLTHGYS